MRGAGGGGAGRNFLLLIGSQASVERIGSTGWAAHCLDTANLGFAESLLQRLVSLYLLPQVQHCACMSIVWTSRRR